MKACESITRNIYRLKKLIYRNNFRILLSHVCEMKKKEIPSTRIAVEEELIANLTGRFRCIGATFQIRLRQTKENEKVDEKNEKRTCSTLRRACTHHTDARAHANIRGIIRAKEDTLEFPVFAIRPEDTRSCPGNGGGAVRHRSFLTSVP